MGNAELPGVGANFAPGRTELCDRHAWNSTWSVGMAEDRVREKDCNLHATYSFVFLMGAAFCDRIRFCSSSSGARLIGPCTIERARAVARRTRDNSSNSSGPKTSKTIIANENHSLIAPHFFAGLAQKKARKIERG